MGKNAKVLRCTKEESEWELNKTLSTFNKYGIGGHISFNLYRSSLKFFNKHNYITQAMRVRLQNIQLKSKEGK